MTLRGGQPDGRRRNIEFGGSMQAVIIAIHLIIVSIMIGVILLQKSEGGGLGIGSTGGFLSSRGTANVLTRTTAILAATFFATSLVLSVLAGMDRKPRAIIQNTGGAPTQQAPGTPAGQGGGGLLDTLRQREQPAAPAPPPSGPQVPRSQ
jgi:preprotein translocase subunit SecG